jgi:hypothetical protein
MQNKFFVRSGAGDRSYAESARGRAQGCAIIILQNLAFSFGLYFYLPIENAEKVNFSFFLIHLIAVTASVDQERKARGPNHTRPYHHIDLRIESNLIDLSRLPRTTAACTGITN